MRMIVGSLLDSNSVFARLTLTFTSTYSWFANTIGIGLCAVKIWFYYPLSGHFLIAITLMLTFLYYPIR